MQKRTMLNKTGITVFMLTCCVLFFVLQGKAAFSSPRVPDPGLIRAIAVIVPNYRYLEIIKADRGQLEYVELADQLIILSKQIMEETEGFYERLPYYIYLKMVRDELSPVLVDVVDEVIISSRQRAQIARANRETAVEEAMSSYIFAENFPEDKIEVFRNFIRYSAPSEIVNARLNLNDKVGYADFLSAVSLALSVQENYLSARARPFLENVLRPLANDLQVKEYRGYRFPVKDLPDFFRRRALYVQRVTRWPRMSGGPPSYLPDEICMAWHYAQTFWLVYEGRLLEAYDTLLRCRRGAIARPPNAQPRFGRAYDFHGDEERHKWFLFLQAELRHAGHVDFADQITEVELEHHRELIVWQLQKRAYLAQRLYENRDNLSLSTLRRRLAQELDAIKSNAVLNSNFENAIGHLRAIDDKMRVEPQASAAMGTIVLPWINRQALDRRMGRNTADIGHPPIQARMIRERAEEENIIDDETEKAMTYTYEWILCYIRALAIVNERFYVENDLKELTQLHSKLINNRNVSRTEVDRYLSRSHIIPAGKTSITITYEMRAEFEEQSRLDMRRLHIITRHFWYHQYRRQNGDITVGDIILPWVEVRDEWF